MNELMLHVLQAATGTNATKVKNRIAAYMLAIDRVSYTIKQRGIYA